MSGVLLVGAVGLVVTMGVTTQPRRHGAPRRHVISPTIGSARIPLVEVFAAVPDPRARRGVRHGVAVVLTVALPLSWPAKSLLAVGEWVAEADRQALTQLGIDPSVVLPSESTIRRVLSGLDAADLDARLGGWMATLVRVVGERTVVAVDGKSLRGASVAGVMPHLLSALEHEHGVVLGQRAVGDKGSEIPALRDLLSGMDLAGVVVTADALHCQRDTATWLIGRGANYVLTVKANQPGLRNALKDLPWSKVPGHTYRDRSHGRTVTQTVKRVTVPAWVHWRGAAQVLQVRRTRIMNGRKRVEVVYAAVRYPCIRPNHGSSRPGSKGIGASRTPCTGSARSPSTKTDTNSASVPDPK